MKRTIVIFSNPFGYGPTGKAVAIAKELLARDYLLDVIFAGGSFARGIVPHEIRCTDIDERNEVEITELLKVGYPKQKPCAVDSLDFRITK